MCVCVRAIVHYVLCMCVCRCTTVHYMCVYVPWYIIHYVCVRDIVCHKLSVYVCMHAMVLCVSVCHGAYVEARGKLAEVVF